jgi:hypothetical protein
MNVWPTDSLRVGFMGQILSRVTKNSDRLVWQCTEVKVSQMTLELVCPAVMDLS